MEGAANLLPEDETSAIGESPTTMETGEGAALLLNEELPVGDAREVIFVEEDLDDELPNTLVGWLHFFCFKKLLQVSLLIGILLLPFVLVPLAFYPWIHSHEYAGHDIGIATTATSPVEAPAYGRSPVIDTSLFCDASSSASSSIDGFEAPVYLGDTLAAWRANLLLLYVFKLGDKFHSTAIKHLHHWADIITVSVLTMTAVILSERFCYWCGYRYAYQFVGKIFFFKVLNSVVDEAIRLYRVGDRFAEFTVGGMAAGEAVLQYLGTFALGVVHYVTMGWL